MYTQHNCHTDLWGPIKGHGRLGQFRGQQKLWMGGQKSGHVTMNTIFQLTKAQERKALPWETLQLHILLHFNFHLSDRWPEHALHLSWCPFSSLLFINLCPSTHILLQAWHLNMWTYPTWHPPLLLLTCYAPYYAAPLHTYLPCNPSLHY